MIKTKDKPVTFAWSGMDKANGTVSGEIEAVNLQVARLLLKKQGIRVRTIRKNSQSLFRFGNTVKVKDIVFFTRQLATMMEAGVPIATSLRGISVGHKNQAVKKLLGSIRKDIEAGTSLSTTLHKYPVHFNHFYTNLVTVGEESGTLDVLMNKIASDLEKREIIKGKTKSALFYPALVMIVAIVIVSILLIVVIPEFETLFSDYGSDLPGLTQWVMNLSYAFQQYWLWVFFGIMATLTALISTYKRSPKMQYGMDRLILSIPVFGTVIRKATITRVARTMATMFGAGIPLVESLETVAKAAGNKVYTQGLLDVRRAVSTGRNLQGSMLDTGLFPGMVLQMVATGEETGKLEHMLDKIAEFFEAEVDNAVAVTSSLVEPFLIIILGVIVGTIVIAMYLPIFKLGAVF